MRLRDGTPRRVIWPDIYLFVVDRPKTSVKNIGCMSASERKLLQLYELGTRRMDCV